MTVHKTEHHSPMTYFHGGKSGLNPNDRLVPSPPHVEDGCPVCEARKAGRVCTVIEFSTWIRRTARKPYDARVVKLLSDLDAAPPYAPIDPPSAQQAVYITTELDCALWYAARSKGDLYQVEPESQPVQSPEDHWPSFTVEAARVVRVIRRNVRLTRTERRSIERQWKKADRRANRKALEVAV